MLLHANKLFATSSSSELSFLNYRNLKQECSVFYSFSCRCIPLDPEELPSADLTRGMHKSRGDDTGQLGSERRFRSAEHCVNTPECPRTSCTPHEYRALGCKGGMWIGLLA